MFLRFRLLGTNLSAMKMYLLIRSALYYLIKMQYK